LCDAYPLAPSEGAPRALSTAILEEFSAAAQAFLRQADPWLQVFGYLHADFILELGVQAGEAAGILLIFQHGDEKTLEAIGIEQNYRAISAGLR
jgi:hypothetical protein